MDDAEIFADQVYKAKKGDATPQFNGTPVRPGYIFVGWEPAVAEKVTTDATYKAKWAPEARTITATWKNGETNETIQGPREYPEGMLPSANEACNVLAEAVSGSVTAFVELMNRRAAELGMEDTHFANSHGYHDNDHYTSAYDIALMSREAMQHE